MKHFYASIILFISSLAGFAQDYSFKGSISREVLENYLERAITLADFANMPKFSTEGGYPRKELDLEFVKDTGAKFIGRAVYRWGGEEALKNPEFFKYAQNLIEKLHAIDPEIIVQAAVFEAVYPGVNKVAIPRWVFEELGMKPEARNFSYDDMLFKDGTFKNHWGRGGSVPDITRSETQLWFMYLVGSYIEIGVEAIHLGQVKLMGANDKDFAVWAEFIGKLRRFADKRARRGKIIFDAHTPDGGMLYKGMSLLDFNSFPLRIREADLEHPELLRGVLQVGQTDSIYKRSAGCKTPNGWECESLPYLVEFDNFGISDHAGRADVNDHFIWGYDEITWLYLQPQEERERWLKYACDWIKKTDKNGHLQMPATRILTLKKDQSQKITVRSVPPQEGISHTLNLQHCIKKIWNKK
ncbi:MAG: hypothetical protein IKO42_08000 [Opitutales bacterium]|nr:hypothetical protein [Opitutales bacterium]